MSHIKKTTRAIATTAALVIFLSMVSADSQARHHSLIHEFNIETYDNLQLPAQVVQSEEFSKYLIVFIGGSTPYNEQGYQAAVWSDKGEPLLERQDLYQRVLNIMPCKGYDLAVVAKRSFVYPDTIPRPSLDDLALDALSFIRHLRDNDFLNDDKKLILAGYSEGSIVAAKVLGLLKRQPAFSVLMGSASLAFDYENKSWEEWYKTEVLRQYRGWTDEEIRKEYESFAEFSKTVRQIDEKTWEQTCKQSGCGGIGIAPWESWHINKEVNVYDPVSDILDANVPVLLVAGEKDEAIPRTLTERTYLDLRDRGFDNVSFRVIPEENHQYQKYDVFAIMDHWITSAGRSTSIELDSLDRHIINVIHQKNELRSEIESLNTGSDPEKVLKCFRRARSDRMSDFYLWFSLGIRLMEVEYHDEALYAFEQSLDPDNIMQYASLVWIGHIYDLQNQRDRAVTHYKQALNLYPGFAVQHSQWDIQLDENWIHRRLDEPFAFNGQ